MLIIIKYLKPNIIINEVQFIIILSLNFGTNISRYSLLTKISL